MTRDKASGFASTLLVFLCKVGCVSLNDLVDVPIRFHSWVASIISSAFAIAIDMWVVSVGKKGVRPLVAPSGTFAYRGVTVDPMSSYFAKGTFLHHVVF